MRRAPLMNTGRTLGICPAAFSQVPPPVEAHWRRAPIGQARPPGTREPRHACRHPLRLHRTHGRRPRCPFRRTVRSPQDVPPMSTPSRQVTVRGSESRIEPRRARTTRKRSRPCARELRRCRSGPPRIDVDGNPEPAIERCTEFRQPVEREPCETRIAGARNVRGGKARLTGPLVRRSLNLISSGVFKCSKTSSS